MKLWLTMAALAATYPLGAQTAGPQGEAAARIVRGVMARAGIPGMQAAVAVKGQVVWSEAFGQADLEQRTPATRATRFRIGSVSKSFTAAALARLVDEGRLDLDALIKRYVAAVPSDTMTVRQVAGHLSGIRNYRGAEFVSREQFDTVQAALKVFIADPLLSEPGRRFAYSSYNYTLLSAAIESAAGQPYMQYMNTAVLAPLDLRGTSFDEPEPIVPDRARWYEKTKDAIVNAPWVNVSNRWAAGGIISTADDMVRFALGITVPGYLSPETLRQLFAPQRTITGDVVNYGIGWRMDPAGSNLVRHGGEAMGARAFLFLDPETRSVVALTSNLGGAPFNEKEAKELLALFSTQGEQPACEHPVPAGARTLPSDPMFNPWGSPWVFQGHGGSTTALPSLRKPKETMGLLMDDGSKGTVSVLGHTPDDERYEITVSDAVGTVVARIPFGAAYNDFQLVPADLVDGPGHELVLVRTTAHSAPRSGNDVKIWKVSASVPTELLQADFRLSGPMTTIQIGCLFWRTDAVVDLSQPKPRSIELRGRVDYRTPCCLYSDADAQKLRTVLTGQVLRFTNGKYALR